MDWEAILKCTVPNKIYRNNVSKKFECNNRLGFGVADSLEEFVTLTEVDWYLSS